MPKCKQIEFRLSPDYIIYLPLIELRCLPEPTKDSCNGVYFLWKGPGLVYVGQSINCVNRRHGHRSLKEIDFDRMTFLECGDLRHLLESLYIWIYRPRFNKSEVKSGISRIIYKSNSWIREREHVFINRTKPEDEPFIGCPPGDLYAVVMDVLANKL